MKTRYASVMPASMVLLLASAAQAAIVIETVPVGNPGTPKTLIVSLARTTVK